MPHTLVPARPVLSASRAAGSAIRVMLVDDSLTTRTIFSRIITAEGDMVLAGQATTAEAALVQLEQARPDVVLLDLEMPGMGGMRALPQLLALAPGTQVLVVSSLTEIGARHTIEALSAGAADTLLKPLPGSFNREYREQLLQKIRVLGRPDRLVLASAAQPAITRPASHNGTGKPARLVAIGASTGGVHAINTVLRALPASFTLPIIITQHLPASFVPVFAHQLQAASGRMAQVADAGTPLKPGTITVAPGDAHMLVRSVGKGLATELSTAPAPAGCWPAVDPMLASVADACEGAAAALILSGMGRDGLIGASALHKAGGTVLAQDAQSCAVWGMPRAVAAAGIAAGTMPPEQMASWLLAHAQVAA